jgi:enoyl-[acyl-carrier-protein] reductase (NADH)
VRPVTQLTDADYHRATQVQLMGQINVFRHGQGNLTTGGSVTLTSGEAARLAFPGAAAIAMACARLERFVAAAGPELDGVRLNVVSPSIVQESLAAMGLSGDMGVSAADTAKAYVAAVHGTMNGERLSTADYV